MKKREIIELKDTSIFRTNKNLRKKFFEQAEEELRKLPISPEVKRLVTEQEKFEKHRNKIVRIKAAAAIAIMFFFVAGIHSIIDLTNESYLYFKLYIDFTLIGYSVCICYCWVTRDIETTISEIEKYFKSPLYSVILWSWPISMAGGVAYMGLIFLLGGVGLILGSLGIKETGWIKDFIILIMPFLKR